MPLLLPKRRFGLKIVHTFYACPAEVPRCDLLRVHQAPSPPEGRGWMCSPFTTLHLDLNKSDEELLGQMSPGTRYAVQRALSRDGLRVDVIPKPSGDDLANFFEFYNPFARMRRISPADEEFLRGLAERSALVLSRVRRGGSRDLAWHAYLVGGRRMRLCHSAALGFEGVTAAQLGRANRLLHWEDIRYAKSQRLLVFDFGGIAVGGAERELEGINRFKLGFGGTLVEEFHCVEPRSVRGRAALALWRGFTGFSATFRRQTASAPRGEGSSSDASRDDSVA
jgi:Acetyltransferase (GNAT) domain